MASRPIELLTATELRTLLRAPSRRAPTGVRNAALLAVLYRSGLRISEALALHPKDLELAAGRITVLHGKGDKRRVVAIDPGGQALLERWLDRRKSLGLTSRQPVFCTLRGTRLDDSYCRQMVKRMAQRAGIEKRVHLHGLRHAFAVELLREGVHVRNIQQALGHSSLSTTAIYLAGLSPEESLTAVRGREWTP